MGNRANFAPVLATVVAPQQGLAMLAPVAPGFVVSDDALGDCGVRPTEAEWSRFVSACDLVRLAHAESA